MTDDSRIDELLESLLESRRAPEDVCRDDPELLQVLRDRWEKLQRVEAQIDSLFPPSRGDGSSGDAATAALSINIPKIPGYDVQGILGHGGVGVVYRARHLTLKRLVAIKMLRAGGFAHPNELARFRHEAEAVAALRHANIVQIYDVGEFQGHPYFTMEYVEGGDLATALRGSPRPAREAATMIATLADAVRTAHAAGLVHRDLKPANILVTDDGTLKISDFGLARRLENDPNLTISVARVGTPSYMAPEQAAGQVDAFCPSVDIYALGAILYELLTGRPPFRAESSAETQRQVIEMPPAPPSRLNARVPREMETICLKCLHKEPQRRYATAAALADDVQRFLRGEPIAARRAGMFERSTKWIRRRPAVATSIAISTLFAIGLLSGAMWFASQRSAMAKAIELDLLEVTTHAARSDWTAARNALQRADARLGDGGTASLREMLQRADDELDLVDRLEEIRLDRTALVAGERNMIFDDVGADAAYEAAFRDAGLGGPGDDVDIVATHIDESRIRSALIAALDDWAACADPSPQHTRRRWILDVARRADPDPTGWRDAVRNEQTWSDLEKLTELAAFAPIETESVQLLVAFGRLLESAGGDAVPFLEAVQRRHAGDFWANFALGLAYAYADPLESVRFFQAAVAIRPQSLTAIANLGTSLGAAGQYDAAIEILQRSLEMDPNCATAHFNIANALKEQRQFEESIEHYTEAVRILPTFTLAHTHLGDTLRLTGRRDEALNHLRRAVELSPRDANARDALGLALTTMGRVDEALVELEEALRLDPNSVTAHNNYGFALRTAGRVDEAMTEFRRAIELDPTFATAHSNLGNALMSVNRDHESVEEFQIALRLQPNDVNTLHGLGVVLGEMGDIQGAVDRFEEALRIDPNFALAYGGLGQALLLLHRPVEARAAFERFAALLPKDDPRHATMQNYLAQCDRMIDAHRDDDSTDDRDAPTIRDED